MGSAVQAIRKRRFPGDHLSAPESQSQAFRPESCVILPEDKLQPQWAQEIGSLSGTRTSVAKLATAMAGCPLLSMWRPRRSQGINLTLPKPGKGGWWKGPRPLQQRMFRNFRPSPPQAFHCFPIHSSPPGTSQGGLLRIGVWSQPSLFPSSPFETQPSAKERHIFPHR